MLIYAKSLRVLSILQRPTTPRVYRLSAKPIETFANTDDINKVRGTPRPELSTPCIRNIQDTISCIALSSRVRRVSFANERTNRSFWQTGFFFPPGPIILHTICTIILFQLCTNGCLIARSRGAEEVPFRKKKKNTPLQSLFFSTFRSIPFLLKLSRNASLVAAMRSVKSLVTLT